MKGERIAMICLTVGLITVGATTYTGKEIKQVEVVQEYQENNLELEKKHQRRNKQSWKNRSITNAGR